MHVAYAFLLLLVVAWPGVSRAQTPDQAQAQPSAASSACAHIPEAPDADSNTHEYNAGYHNGYLEACQAIAASQHQAPGPQVSQHKDTGVHTDSAINTDILVPPDQAGISLARLDTYNGKLLAMLQHVCPKHYRELKEQARENSVWDNFTWRMNVLQEDIVTPKSPEKCQ